MKEEKNRVIVLICLFVTLIIVTIVTIFVNRRNDNVIMKKAIEEIGRRFYNEYLYEKQKDVINNAINKNSKITFNFNSLSLFISAEDWDKMNNSKIYDCNWQETTIAFIPKYPIAKDNFDIQVKLVC